MSKINPANAESERLFEIQKTRTDRDPLRRFCGIILIIFMLSATIFLGSSVWIFQKSGFSENENRFLANIPEFSKDSITSGNYMRGVSEFISDSFPFRENFIMLRSNIEKLLQKNEVNGVIIGKNGVLAERPDLSRNRVENLREAEYAINLISKNFEERGIKSTVAIAPFAVEIHKNNLPTLFFTESFGINTQNTVYLNGALSGESDIWFNTDHHWTAYGAYLAYVSLGDSLGYIPYGAEYFTEETVSESFYGTAYSKSGLYSTSPDKITLLRYDGDEKFYDMSALLKKDKYAVFLGGNHAYLSIQSGEEKPRLLIIKDSYANSAIPFLALHFNLEIVDPRYFSGDIYEIAEKCDSALFLYGASSLLTDRDLVRLTLN